jgi:cysteine desulfurase
MIYLDNNATTRPDPTVVEAMLPYWSELYLNPSSVAGEMLGSAKPIHAAKHSLAELIHADPNEIFLTSGATESNNWVIQSLASRRIQEKGSFRILTSAIEHPSILETIEALQSAESRISHDLIPVHPTGQINLEVLGGMLNEDTDLVSIMLANNESGVIQPIQKAASLIKSVHPACIVHTDATQAVGKILVDLSDELQHVDMLSLSAHKFHGPKGIGALFRRSGVALDPFILGGNQQFGMRAGTENPALAAGLAKAADLAAKRLPNQESVARIRDAIEAALPNGMRVIAGQSERLPNTSLLLSEKIEGEMLVHCLYCHGVIASTGAACSTGADSPSHVALAMGIDFSQARRVIRLSLGLFNSEDEIKDIIRAMHASIDDASG